jgi:Zn-dependent peptidase ImmA (M78 family)/DNA-binding XRE family transcriptional regulator
MTKTALAEKVGVSVRVITAYESGEYGPLEDTATKIAGTLSFPLGFFSGPDIDEVNPDAVSFRSLTSMTASQRESALAAGSLAIELNKWIEEHFELPAIKVPSMRGFDPETAAHALRAEWGLGERCVNNMVHLLEAKGVRVFSLPVDSASVDAFSVWRNDTPFVFLNSLKSGERGRFDAAHELAHLTLHQHGSPRGRQAEMEADKFASAFLMPAGSILASAPREPSLEHLIVLKGRWKVALTALVQRFKALNLLSDWRYRMLWIEISQRGFRKSEPPARIERETSQILTKVFTMLREEGTSAAALARELLLHTEELESLIRGLIMSVTSALPGGRKNVAASNRTGRAAPELKLITNEQ